MEDLNTLFEDIVNLHLGNYYRAKQAYQDGKLDQLNIAEDYKLCPLQKNIDILKEECCSAHAKHLELLHRDWHESFMLLKATKDPQYLSKMHQITISMKSYIGLLKNRF